MTPRKACVTIPPMKKKNIVLIGFMGSGKSFVSRGLGKILKREVFSTDSLIEEQAGRSIPIIFKRFGEAYFREIEKDVVRKLVRKQGVILDCGGGVIVDPFNVVRLRKNGILIYLKASPRFLYQNIKGRKRPLLNLRDPLKIIKRMLSLRKPLYEASADYIIDSEHKSIEDICHSIVSLLSCKNLKV